MRKSHEYLGHRKEMQEDVVVPGGHGFPADWVSREGCLLPAAHLLRLASDTHIDRSLCYADMTEVSRAFVITVPFIL